MLTNVTFVSEEVTKNLTSILEKSIDNNYVINEGTTCTINGIQTLNCINNIDKNTLNEIITKVKNFIDSLYKDNLKYYEFFIDHIHLIYYYPGGHQLPHDHIVNEDISFIIYLNDSDGITRLYYNGTYKDINPQKNKIIIFNSSIYHEGLKSKDVKMIAAGSVKFKEKMWIDRRYETN